MTTAWRICKAVYATTAFDGAGAARLGGRWNSPGIAAVYTADSRAAAILELSVHTDADGLALNYVLISVDFKSLAIETLDVSGLPTDWMSDTNIQRAAGDAWLKSNRTAVLCVPSVIVPGEVNYVLNPLHPDFKKIAIGVPIAFLADPRIKA